MPKKLRLLAILLCLTAFAYAQKGRQTITFTSATSGQRVSLGASGIKYHTISWVPSGTVTTCQVQLDTSNDGTNWTPGGAIVAQNCTVSGNASSTSVTTNYVRITVSTFTGTGSVKVTWIGYDQNPSGGGTVQIHGAITPGNCTSWFDATTVQDSGGGCGGSPALNSVSNLAASKTFDNTTFNLTYTSSGNYGASPLVAVTTSNSNVSTGPAFRIATGTGTTHDVFQGCALGTTNCIIVNSSALLTTTGTGKIDLTKGQGALPGVSGAALTGLLWSQIGSTPTTLSGYGITNAVANTLTVNGKALSGNITLFLASSDFANQGTTTTVLHGNAAGNPAFSAIVAADAPTLAPKASPTFTGTVTLPITGTAQCLQVDTSGVISGTGTTCTVGGTVAATQVAFASGSNTLAGSGNFTYSSSAGISLIGGANNVDVIYAKRFTDTTPTGNLLHFQNNAANTDLFKVDVTGAVSATSYGASNASGNAGQLYLVQGTAPSNVANAVNLIAPTSVTTYSITFPGTVAAGFWNQNASGVLSFGALSGDVTSSGLVTTVAKINGNSVPSGAVADQILVATGANTLAWKTPATCNADATHASQYNPTTHTFDCGAITATASPAGSNTQVQFNNGGALGASAGLTWVSPALTIGQSGTSTGILALAGATSGTTSLTTAATASGTWTFRATTDNVVGAATTDAFTNKTYNGLTITTSTGTLTITNGKIFGVSNTMTLAGTDGSTYTMPGASATMSFTVASGTSALGTGAIASGACATAVTTSATGTATTDVIWWGFNGDPSGVTGYAPTTNGMLTILAYPSANNVNFKVCNNTSASVTPGAITLNWRVVR